MKKVMIVAVSFVLASCAGRYASNGESLYLKSKNGPGIDVPSPLTRANISDFYNLPPQNQDARISIAPPK